MKKLWISFAIVFFGSFAVLGWIGTRIYQEMPPLPNTVVDTTGRVVVAAGDIERGQNVWQALGGMEVGSIWGHGSYVAPDWTADWLHREVTFVLNEWSAKEYGKGYDALSAEDQGRLQGRLQEMYRRNDYDPATMSLRIDPIRARAFEACLAHFSDVFINGNEAYAIPKGSVSTPQRMRQFAGFMFWTAWSAAATRRGDAVSYTNNWPYEPLVGNRPTGDTVLWTGVSIMMLLAGVCGMVWWYASQSQEEYPATPTHDPLASWSATPSQRATLKYFWVVSALILVQILMGMVTAHYGVEGNGFYGIKIAEILPYSVTRTWHVQIGIFWIATAWLAAGLFIGPLVSGQEPKHQSLGVHVLFGALLVVVAGSLAGEWMSIENKLSDSNSFLWGHQGYEYVDLGRGWQILLFIGLLIWLFLVVRAIWPAMKKDGGEHKQLLWLFLMSAAAIGLFYGAGLSWGQHTHLSIVEYWRWWVVHLWVEGFFEVFATTVIAFLFTRLGLIRPAVAAKTALLSATIFLAGGIIGTCHHLYFSGTPTVALAFGSVFSALEVVPLTMLGYSALDDLRRKRMTVWAERYKWPIYYFVAVAFWNMVGAGLFGFMINPPIALYFMQGLNTTPLHGHAALFGVYGMLGIGLMLVCLRAMDQNAEWSEGLLRFAFWGMNIGLFMMCVGSLLPVGLAQTWASVEHGYWFARSSEFLHSGWMQTLRWMRVPGDTVFALGAMVLVWFVFAGRSRKVRAISSRPVPAAAGD